MLWINCFITPFLSLCVWAQTPKPQTPETKFVNEALKLMSDSSANYTQAIVYWEKAAKANTQQPLYSYELAYCHYELKQYEKSIEILKKTINKNASLINANYYRLLGNAYDLGGKPDKAINTYTQGLAKFAEAGELYNELGGMYYKQGNNDKAVDYWEQGVDNAPKYASNYYWLAKLYCNSSERMWGIMYAELFINLEPNTHRTLDISTLLANTYQQSLQTNANRLYMFSKTGYKNRLLEDLSTPDIPLFTAFEIIAQQLISKQTYTNNSLAAVHLFRLQFAEHWQKQNMDKRFDNVLFSWHNQLITAGHFEAYNYWLLREGNKIQFNEWLSANKNKFGAFIQWITKQPLTINAQNRFGRSTSTKIVTDTK